jgi:ribosome maturation factor RimP
MPSVQQSALHERLTSLGERAAAQSGVEMVEIELKGAGKSRLLRVFIDKPGGVTHADCESVSHSLGQLLDEEDAIPDGEGYTLEVSSPGVERKLGKPRDFERVVGQGVRIATREPIEGATRFAGKLAGFADQVLRLEIAPDKVIDIPLSQVQKANLKFEW